MADAARWPQVALLLLLLPLASTPSRAAAPARSSSTAVFQLHGDVYPTGHYYAAMSIGEPAKPYFLDVDTGSDLTWLQCDAPCQSCNKVPHPLYRPSKDKLVPCADSLCTALHSGQGSNQKCPSPKQCDYRIKYTDNASSMGVLITDHFSLPLRNSSNVRPSLTFGCGYDQQAGKNGAVQAATDGMLGLGRGSISLLSQLKKQGITKNVLGHCLSTRGGGFLFFGDDMVPTSRVTWVPMARSTSGNYYSPGSATLYFDKHPLGVKPMEVVFDSGSTYTYFAAQPYQAVVSALKGGLSKSLKQVSDPSLPLCWKGQKAFKSVFDVKKEFKSLFLSFANRKNAVMEIPPENYLIVTKNGNVCLGILDGAAAKLSFNVIGDITMQDQMVIYDNEKTQLGWVRGPCSRSVKGPHELYKGTKNKLVPCAHQHCDALHEDMGKTKDCRNTPTQCDYEIHYTDGAQSLGVLLIDKFSFPMGNGVSNLYRDIAFGCGYDQVEKDNRKTVAVDGILGLGRGSADFVSQLKSQGLITKNVISHCLSRNGGRLILGEHDVYPSLITWVPMAKKIPGKINYYSPAGQATLQLDKNSVVAKQVQVVFDSGSTYTYLPLGIYKLLISALKRSLSTSLREVTDPALETLCWTRNGGFKSLDDLKAEFKPVVSLKFEKGTMVIPPENYLIITERGNACLGMLKMPNPNLDMIIIGDITMQDQLVIYDNEKVRLGWMSSQCDSKSISAIISRM